MADHRKVQQKRTNTKKIYKYPPQQIVVPPAGQQAIYPQQIYPVTPQTQPYQMPVMQPVQRNPKTGNQIVAVPIGPPITVAQPVGSPMMMPTQPVAPPPQVVVTPPVPPQNLNPPNSKPNVIINRYYTRDNDCCNIF